MERIYVCSTKKVHDTFDPFMEMSGEVYPVPMNLHYIPEALTDIEMMKVAVSWNRPELYAHSAFFNERVMGVDLLTFMRRMKLWTTVDDLRIIIIHGQDANSRLLLYTMTSLLDSDIYHIDVTPDDYKPILRETTDEDRVNIHQEDEYVRQYDPKIFSVEDVSPEMAEKLIGTEKLVTAEERDAYREIWSHWGGEDTRNFPILVDQYGMLFHPYDTYLNDSIFKHTPKDNAAVIGEIACAVAEDHPQVSMAIITDHIVKMANQRQIKWASEPGPEGKVVQYRADIAGRWNYYQDMHFLQEFASYAGKTISLSPEDIEAENARENKDSQEFYGKGHLYRAAKARSRKEWKQKLLIKWAAANNENWGWYHLLEVMKAKLEMMVEYMRDWSHIVNGPVYADQMERAISLIEVCIAWGGENDYKHDEDEEHYFDEKHFSHYVNTRNAARFPSPDYDGHDFWCEVQRLRFDKAWNILWEMLRTKLITWDD